MKTVILFTLMAICTLSCVSPTKPTIFLTQELKDYTDFKLGSYWIYKDTSNLKIQDSIALIYQKPSITPAMDGADGPPPAEAFNDTFFSSKDGKFTANGTAGIDDYHVKYSTWQNEETVYFTPASGIQYDDWGSMTYLGDISTANFSGNTYHSVKEFEAQPNSQFPIMPQVSHVYWSKHIGIVQKTVLGTTWVLVRYHMVQ